MTISLTAKKKTHGSIFLFRFVAVDPLKRDSMGL